MRWLSIIAVMALLGYFDTDRMIIFFACVMLALGLIGNDTDNLEKKLTAIKDHSEQSRDAISRRFDAVDQMSAETLKEAEYIASRMRSLEAEIELLRKHLMPDNHRPWDA